MESSLSISNEKPPQLPHDGSALRSAGLSKTFNLKREAAPVATRHAIGQHQHLRDLSISNEKPPQLPRVGAGGATCRERLSISNEKPPQLPRDMPEANISIYEIFQSQTRSRPSCHASALAALLAGRDFQSQTRSRPSCHACLAPASRSSRSLSISNEKPPQLPPAMMVRRRCCQMPTFNLKREAAPVATFERLRENCIGHPLSISNEKPPQLPHLLCSVAGRP